MRNRYCIYFLIKDGAVVYIGASRNLPQRLKAHKYDKPHDSVRVISDLTRGQAFKYEMRWIKKFKPMHNKQKDKVGGRKKVKPADKMILVGFYVQQSVIDLLGGKDKTREIAKEHVEHKAEVEETGRFAMHG